MTTRTTTISGDGPTMTAGELRAALADVPADFGPTVRTTMRGHVKSITVTTQGASDADDPR